MPVTGEPCGIEGYQWRGNHACSNASCNFRYGMNPYWYLTGIEDYKYESGEYYEYKYSIKEYLFHFFRYKDNWENHGNWTSENWLKSEWNRIYNTLSSSEKTTPVKICSNCAKNSVFSK